MWGGPGGPGGNLLMLAGNEAVQKELKLTDKQKAQIKKVSEDSNNRRREVFQNLRQQADAAKNQAIQEAQAEAAAGQQIDPSLAARGSGAGNPLINSLNNRGYQPPIYGGQPLTDPEAEQQGQQAQIQARANNAQAQGWQMMREAMDQLQQESEGSLGRVLDKNQVKRIKEIQLQVEGPFAVLRPEIAERLELAEDQVAQIQEIQNESNQARRQAMAANRDIFTGFRKSQPGNNNQPGAAQADPNAPAGQPQGANNGGGGGNGRGRNGRGGPGGNGPGGNGPGGRGNFDPTAFQKYMEQPEVKAKMDQMRRQQDQIRDQSYAKVYRVLDRRQSAAFKKMLGKPFDVDLVIGGFFRRPGQGGAATKNDTAKSDTAKPADAAAKSTAKSDQPSASKPATGSRRQSLRERRGLGQQPQ
jgi:hypothetical protein